MNKVMLIGNVGRDPEMSYTPTGQATAKFSLAVNGKEIAAWAADDHFPSRQPNGDNSTRYTARGVELKPGDVIRVEGTPDGDDPAALDYVEVETAGTEH